MLYKEARNNLDPYIYHIKNNIVDDEEAVNVVSSEEQCADLCKLANEIEYFMYSNNCDADKSIFEDNCINTILSMEKIKLHISESNCTATTNALKYSKGQGAII